MHGVDPEFIYCPLPRVGRGEPSILEGGLTVRIRFPPGASQAPCRHEWLQWVDGGPFLIVRKSAAVVNNGSSMGAAGCLNRTIP